MRNLFHSYIAGLFVFIFSLSAWADMYKHVEVIVSRHGNRDIYVTDVNGNKTRVGTIVTWKKGKTLFHWGKGTPEQAARWDAAGKISVDTLNWLKANQSGFIGSGFYVSENPADSFDYGNVLVAVELPKDIELIRADKLGPNGSSAEWNEIIDKAGVAGAIHNNTDSWANIRDAEALTKEYVMTPERIEKLKPHGALGVMLLENFAQAHPEFAQTNWFKRERALSARAELILRNNSPKKMAAVRKYLNKGTYQAADRVDSIPENAPSEVLYRAVHGHNFWQYGASRFTTGSDNLKRAIEIGLLGETDRGLSFAMNTISQLSLDERIKFLEFALEYWNDDPPKLIADRIDSMKRAGVWNSKREKAPLCSSAFSP